MKSLTAIASIAILIISISTINSTVVAQTPYDISVVLPENIARVKAAPDMISALKILQKCTDHCFAIEGMPLHRSVQKGMLQEIKLPTDKVIHAEDIIKEITRIYDYSLTESNNIYIFTKNYSNSDDFPEITTQELKTFLKNVSITANRFSTNYASPKGVNPNFLSFSKSLSPEEMNQLNFGESQISSKALQDVLKLDPSYKPSPGVIQVETWEEFEKLQTRMLRFSTLKPQHQNFFKQVAFSEFVGKPIGEIRRGISIINELDASETNFLRKKNGIFDSFMCTRKVSPDRTYQTSWSPASRISLNFGSAMILQQPLTAPEPDDPKPSDYDSAGKPLPRNVESKNTLTLFELGEQLNQKRKPGPEFTTDPMLYSKKITFLDSGKASPRDIWNAVAQIYNLSVIIDDTKMTLAVPIVKSCATWEEVSRQIESIFPGPLLRFCKAAQVNIDRREVSKMRKEMIDNRLIGAETAPIGRERSYDVLKGIDELRWCIIARLRIQLEPRAKLAKDQILPWSDLTDEEKQWTSFVFACEAVPIAYKLAYSGLPIYIKNPSDCIVSGRVYESQGRKFLRVAIRTPGGNEGFSSVGMIEGLKK
jgi:hypothetical protein